MENKPQKERTITKTIQAKEKQEGNGARVKRTIGSGILPDLDPFLLLDEFFVQPPAGFPDHPHRGFQTVTYMLDGAFKHKDNKGHEGTIRAGDVQWMTAGRGIVHSEMPATEGVNHGLQLWVNLAAKDKMTNPEYQELTKDQIAEASPADGVKVKVIAGTSAGVKGSVHTMTPSMFVDIKLSGNAREFKQEVPSEFNGFAYVLSGAGKFGGETQGTQADLLLLGDGDVLTAKRTGDEDLHFVVIAGQPLKEPVAKYGPFVMNTDAEIRQAILDYQMGKL